MALEQVGVLELRSAGGAFVVVVGSLCLGLRMVVYTEVSFQFGRQLRELKFARGSGTLDLEKRTKSV